MVAWCEIKKSFRCDDGTTADHAAGRWWGFAGVGYGTHDLIRVVLGHGLLNSLLTTLRNHPGLARLHGLARLARIDTNRLASRLARLARLALHERHLLHGLAAIGLLCRIVGKDQGSTSA